ncbi:bifunctional phosphopantothenoylcysteine decarboxylase/phosphopantothenate--cysteine ligase CoaBC [Synechococcus sp. MIT S9504]|uniref:bifunctional phosphopantothenoylcysteine decarboxylase/phosphopantothenate--cysteine ligase CoaBC n=1 Tax=Synechococcus sp. MIT S9504 TaxID=1801628 RepID=UPI0007BC685E|nr:bifunctional phosphopantothenoylcysteine decarboxylase/phosphopantothenate--cysteine ligase CoaBC [Synechococcus sp. MIT S9504]KZR85639.1 Coenzyme A biosynthesis bifunctional protein CoaBC [Synechococcus sp. MIT S9504]
MPALLKGRRVLVAASGSIAAVKTPLLVSALVQAGAQVRCVLTASAARLVSPVALATLSREPCLQDADQWDSTRPRPLHIELAEWADLVVVAPLSATSLSRWVQGDGEGLLASLLLACECPVLAAPAMNTAMWKHPAVQRNWGFLVDDPRVLPLAPESGLLACDRLGTGRMADPVRIELAAASALLQADAEGLLKSDWRGRHVLVSAGPTLEALDCVRVFSNRSSGRMGVLLAQAAHLRGATVDLVHGPLQVPPSWLEGLRCHPVVGSAAMDNTLQQLQPQAHAVLMCAAVADLRRTCSADVEKLPKDQLIGSIEAGWELAPDLLQALVRRRPKGQSVLGFAALTGSDEQLLELGRRKLQAKGCDLLMVNPVDRPGQGLDSDQNAGWLLGPGDHHQICPLEDKLALSHRLLDRLLEITSDDLNQSAGLVRRPS